jgi:hypothetical protein
MRIGPSGSFGQTATASPADSRAAPVEVVRYSSLDDEVYLGWADDSGRQELAALPRSMVVGRPSELIARLRALGLTVEPAHERELASSLAADVARYPRCR